MIVQMGKLEAARGVGSCHSSHRKGELGPKTPDPYSITLLYIKWDLGDQSQFLHL